MTITNQTATPSSIEIHYSDGSSDKIDLNFQGRDFVRLTRSANEGSNGLWTLAGLITFVFRTLHENRRLQTGNTVYQRENIEFYKPLITAISEYLQPKK